MKNELILATTQGVCTAITELVKTFRKYRSVRKENLVVLEARLKALAAVSRTRAIGEAIRANIAEIAQTYRFIAQQNLSGPVLEMAMEQLRYLGELLRNNISAMYIGG